MHKEIKALEEEKLIQHSQEAKDDIEDQIIDLVDSFLLSDREYKAVTTEYIRLKNIIYIAIEIAEYTVALNGAFKETRGAIGAQIADFAIPGKIGTIGSAIQTRIASNAQMNAKNILNKIPETKRELIAMRDTKLTDIIEGLDVMFDAIQIATKQSGIDITSAVSAYDHHLQTKNIKKIGEASWNMANKINALDLERKFNDIQNLIKNSIANARRY